VLNVVQKEARYGYMTKVFRRTGPQLVLVLTTVSASK
jgi:hypothetical protein